MGPRHRGRLGTLLLCAVASVVAAVVVPARPAAADQTLNSGAVVTLRSRVALPAPVDGRLNGYGFASQVTGAGFAPTEHDAGGAGTVTAGPGTELAVIDLRLQVLDSTFVPWLSVRTMDGPWPTATLIVAGATRVALPYNPGLTGDAEVIWATAIPKGAAVTLEVARAGFAQDLDLRTRTRGRPPATALYRDPKLPFVRFDLGATQTLTATTPTGVAAPFQISLDTAALSLFPPESETAPPDAAKAWLLVALSGNPPDSAANDDVITIADPLPGTALELVLPDGTSQPASHEPKLGQPGMFGGLYYFPVPPTITTARIVIQPGSAVAAINGTASGTGDPITLAFTTTATFDITVPAAQPNRRPPSTGSAATFPSRSTGSGHSGGGLPVGWLSLAALVVLAVVLIAARGRRSGLPVKPVAHTQAALMVSAGPLTLAPPAGPWALPIGAEVVDARATADDHGPLPPPMAGPRLVILVLGPLQVEGLRHRVRRKPAIRLLVYLALNLERTVPADTLRFALATSDEREPSEGTLYNYASHLRQALPDGILPTNQPGGYRLGPGVELDWAFFQGLVTQADTHPADRLRLLDTALRLVRGEPLADSLWPGIEPEVRRMVATIETTVHHAATEHLAAGDPRGAEWALSQGMLASPGSPGLWEDRLVAAAAGSGYGLERAWTDAQKVLGADAGLIEATYQSLRSAPV